MHATITVERNSLGAVGKGGGKGGGGVDRTASAVVEGTNDAISLEI
jgi:hypothetical protein